MSGFQGLDPELLRDLGATAGEFATTSETTAVRARELLAACMLDSGAPELCEEISQELRLLDTLCAAKATEMELAALGLSFFDSGVSAALAALLVSLNDGVGELGLVGDNALGTLLLGFGRVDVDGDGKISHDELRAAADDRQLPTEVRLAARTLLDNPGLADNAMSVSLVDAWPQSAFAAFPEWAITSGGLRLLLEQNEMLRILSDQSIFDEMESAGDDGKLDGRLSTDDLDAILESTSASPEARTVARFLVDHPSSFGWFAIGSASADGPITHVNTSERFVDFDDLLSLTIGQHAFAADPAGARRWTLSLADRATWMDVSGKTSGIDIRLSSDDGLRALGAAALADATTLADQVAVVATMPESRGGVRNQLITFYYAELAGRMNERLNIGLDPDNPRALGHSGANWMQFAPWASNSVGPAIRAEVSAYLQSPSWSDRQYAADGNQYIFGDVAIRYAEFLEAFPPGAPIDAASIEQFFMRPHPIVVRRDLFDGGHGQLRDSFAYYLAAIEATDPVIRQRLTMQANLLIATHEQAGAQHALAGIVDLDVGDDGWFRGTIGEFGGWLMEGSDEKVATNRMQLVVGFGDERHVISMSEDLLETSSPYNNRILHDSLAGVLNPEGRPGVDVGNIRVGFDTAGDVRLPDIGGWDDPPDGSGMDPFPTDVREWQEQAGFELSASDRRMMEHLGQDPDALPSTFGTDTHNWADPNERQWFISNLFQQMHTDPVLFAGLDDLTIDSDWGSGLSYLPDNVAAATR